MKSGISGLLERARARLMPPGRMLPSVWADARRRLSAEASAEAGRWVTARAPYQRAMMDAVATHQTVVLATAAQMGKSEVLLNISGAWMETDPGSMLMVLPTLEMARAFSRDRISPMIRDTPTLASIFPATKSRATGQTALRREFQGGQLSLAGANAAAGLASRPVRFLVMDEVDRFPEQAGIEGDPVRLAMARQSNFWDRRTVLASTPTNKGLSRIWTAFEQSTGAQWLVPCPRCGVFHALEWAGVKWDADAGPQSARMVCPRGCEFSDREKKAAVLLGRWEEQRPGHPVAGFRINALASPWADVRSLVAEFLDSKGQPQQLKAFLNLRLAEVWEDVGAQAEPVKISSRAEDYGAEVPAGVLAITAGVDVQADRLEVELVGWGLGLEAWGLGYHVLSGDTVGPVPWKALDALLAAPLTKADGRQLKAARVAIDGAYNTEAVAAYVRARAAAGAMMTWGSTNKAAPVAERAMRARRMGWTIGVHQIKEALMNRIKAAEPSGPGALHWPTGCGYDAEYFRGLCAEELRSRLRRGFKVFNWVKLRERNEPLDCRVLATAAAHRLPPDAFAPARTVQPARPGGAGFVNAWRE